MLRLILGLYVIFGFASTAMAQQTPACSLNEEARIELKNAARGLFSGLIFAEDPYYAGNLSFRDEASQTLSLEQLRGKFLLVNMWAMWCAPCRAEMADFAQLKRRMGGEDFDIIAINMDRDSIENQQIEAFLTEVGATNLALYRDESQEVFKTVRRSIPARGLPLSLIVDKQGCVVASYAGAAPWGNEDGVHFINALKELRQD